MCTGNENSKPIWNKFIIRKDIIETSQVVLNFGRTVYIGTLTINDKQNSMRTRKKHNLENIMVFNASVNNISVISWRSVLLVEETRVPGEKLKSWKVTEKLVMRFSSFLVNNNPLSRKSWYEPQVLEYLINWEYYTLHAGVVGMLLHNNGKITMGKLKSSLLP